jgi:hypothetical protein
MRSTPASPSTPLTAAPTQWPDPILVRMAEAVRISGLSRSALYKLNQAELLTFRKFGRTDARRFQLAKSGNSRSA